MKAERDIIYLSGGITKNPNYRKDFKRAERKMRAAGFEVINPVTLISTVPLRSHQDYMDIALAWLKKADAVYMLCGWTTSEGAMIEHRVAKAKGIPIHYEDGAEREEK